MLGKKLVGIGMALLGVAFVIEGVRMAGGR